MPRKIAVLGGLKFKVPDGQGFLEAVVSCKY